MESLRLPRFRRSTEVPPIQLTDRDRVVLRQLHQHRYLRSDHLTALVPGSAQQTLRRLQLLYHHGYLDRPRSQIDYFHHHGSRKIAYGLSGKGASLLWREHGLPFPAGLQRSDETTVGRIFLEHALLVSEFMVRLELACRRHGRVRLLTGDELPLPEELRRHREPFRWQVTLPGQIKCGVVPDRVFALEFASRPAKEARAYFFLEADRGTMPVMRESLEQTSIHRKLLAYAATWTNGVHRERFGWNRFRVLTVTHQAERVASMIEACNRLERGHGLFLFTSADALRDCADLWKHPWRRAHSQNPTTLIE